MHVPVDLLSNEVEGMSSAPIIRESDQVKATSRPSRPIRRRKVKELNTKDELRRKRFKVSEQLLVAQQKPDNIMQRPGEVLLFSRTQSTSEELVAQEYFKILCRRALERRKVSETDENGTQSTMKNTSIPPDASGYIHFCTQASPLWYTPRRCFCICFQPQFLQSLLQMQMPMYFETNLLSSHLANYHRGSCSS